MAGETTGNENKNSGINIPFSVSFLSYDGDLDRFFQDYVDGVKKANKEAKNEFVRTFKDGKKLFGVSFAQVGENQYKELFSELTQTGRVKTKGGKPVVKMGDFVYTKDEVDSFSLQTTSFANYKKNSSPYNIVKSRTRAQQKLEDDASRRLKNQQDKLDEQAQRAQERFELREDKRQWSREWQNLVGDALPKDEEQMAKLSKLKNELRLLGQEYEDIRMKMRGLDESSPEYQEEVNNLEKVKSKAKETSVAISSLKKEIAEDSKKNFILKLWDTFKRVGFYRIARGIFASIGQGFKTGVQSLVQFDQSANRTMSSLSTSIEKIYGSITLMAMPLVQIIEPVVGDISRWFASIAENISKASSAMQGISSYTKISDEYMKDLASEAQGFLASFDKFNSINGKTSMFDTAEMSQEEMDEAKTSNYAKIIGSVREILTNVWEIIKAILASVAELWDVISPHIGPIVAFALKIIEVLTGIGAWILKTIAEIITFLENSNLLEIALYGVLLAITLIKATQIADWFIKFAGQVKNVTGKVSEWVKKLFESEKAIKAIQVAGSVMIGILSYKIFSDLLKDADDATKWAVLIISAITAVAVAWMALQGALTWGSALPVLGIAIGAGIASAKSLMEPIKAFENGGVAEKGSLFYANEKGPELVYSGHNNSASIMNIEQFETAMSGALFGWWDVAKYDLPESGSFSFTGADVARSKSFINEFNRRNANVKIQ